MSGEDSKDLEKASETVEIKNVFLAAIDSHSEVDPSFFTSECYGSTSDITVVNCPVLNSAILDKN